MINSLVKKKALLYTMSCSYCCLGGWNPWEEGTCKFKLDVGTILGCCMCTCCWGLGAKLAGCPGLPTILGWRAGPDKG